jgi:hypothetical protein
MRLALSKRLLAPLLASLSAPFLILHAAAVGAQGPEPAPIIAVRLHADEQIHLDGTLSDPAWQRAPIYRDFVEKEPKLGRKPEHETLVQVLYDDKAVYVGVTALDPHPEQIRDTLVRHDAVIRTQDFVVVYIDPIGKKQSAQWVRVNAAGSTADGMQTASDDSEDFAPDFDFDAAAKRNEHGYTAVVRIPFSSLRYSREAGNNWRIMVGRRVPRDQFYLITSVPVPDDAPNFLVNMQRLSGIEMPKESGFLTLRPSVTLRHETSQDDGSPKRSDTRIQTTLDLKWRPTPELVIDGTIKPDFSQVDLDVPQLGGNTRYALSFAEKRPFFFEASDILRSPTDALYTRSFTSPSWGMRATWRGQTQAGTAIAVNDRGGGQVLLPGPFGTDVADQPSSRTLAVRQLNDVGALQIGGILAARRYDHDIGENTVLGPDAGWQVNDSLRLRAQWLHSHTTAQPDGNGSLQQGPATDGDHVYFRAVNQTEFDQADVTINDIGRGFRYDSSFVNQAGIRMVETHYGRTWRDLGPFNQFWLNVNLNQARDRGTGETVKTDFFPGIWFSAAKNTQASLELHGLSEVRAAQGAPLLHEKYLFATYTTTPTSWIPLLDSSLSIGRVADVVANAVRPGARLNLMVRTRPLKQFEFEPQISYANLYRDGEQTYRETAVQLKGIWFFNAANNLRLILQRTSLDRLAEPGVDESRDKFKVASLTYTWRRSAGTVLYVGASYSNAGVATTSRGSEAFVKLQFDLDEMKRMF